MQKMLTAKENIKTLKLLSKKLLLYHHHGTSTYPINCTVDGVEFMLLYTVSNVC